MKTVKRRLSQSIVRTLIRIPAGVRARIEDRISTLLYKWARLLAAKPLNIPVLVKKITEEIERIEKLPSLQKLDLISIIDRFLLRFEEELSRFTEGGSNKRIIFIFNKIRENLGMTIYKPSLIETEPEVGIYNKASHQNDTLEPKEHLSANKSEYVIIDEDADKSMFWSGVKWVEEYPDAQLYKSPGAAKKDIKKITEGKPVIVKDYGLESEEVVG